MLCESSATVFVAKQYRVLHLEMITYPDLKAPRGMEQKAVVNTINTRQQTPSFAIFFKSHTEGENCVLYSLKELKIDNFHFLRIV